MNISILPTEINLLIIELLKLQDVINLASVNRYFHDITSSYLEKYHEFNDKCISLEIDYKTYVPERIRLGTLKNRRIYEAVYLGDYKICEFVFSKYDKIFYMALQYCLLIACEAGKTEIVQLIINNQKKMDPCNCISYNMKQDLFKAACIHNHINVLEWMISYYEINIDDYDKMLDYVLKKDNTIMFEALVVQDNFQISGNVKLNIYNKFENGNESTLYDNILWPYLRCKTTIDVIEACDVYDHEHWWLSLFKTPYAINKIKHKKLILQNLNN